MYGFAPSVALGSFIFATAIAATAAHAERVFATVDSDGVPWLIAFDSLTPDVVDYANIIVGLAPGETILGLDYRPVTRQFYAVTSDNRLYTIDRHTALATAVTTIPFTTALAGERFGFDFNPQIDRIRNVSDADQNLVLNPNTGLIQLVATNVAYAAGDANLGADPMVVHHAYDKNNPGTTATQLRAIDANLDVLVTQANNAGVLGTIGSLGVDFSPVGAFDVSGATGIAYAVSTEVGADDITLGASDFYTIDLATGAATPVGTIGVPAQILYSVIGMAVLPELACPADFNFDGKVDGADLGMLLGDWQSHSDLFDLDDDNVVDGADLGILMWQWSACS